MRNFLQIILLVSTLALIGVSCPKKSQPDLPPASEQAPTSLKVPAPGFEGIVDEMIVNQDPSSGPSSDEIEAGLLPGDTQDFRTAPAPTTDPTPTPVPEPPAPPPVQQLSFNGPYLVNATSPVLEFNQADYDKAVAAGKLVVVTFYANWCPICATQQPNHFDALRSLNNPNVVAFRVNYKDSETDDDEVNLARNFGIAFQDTKCIVKNGVRVVKSTEFWSVDRYINEINSNL